MRDDLNHALVIEAGRFERVDVCIGDRRAVADDFERECERRLGASVLRLTNLRVGDFLR